MTDDTTPDLWRLVGRIEAFAHSTAHDDEEARQLIRDAIAAFDEARERRRCTFRPPDPTVLPRAGDGDRSAG